MSHVRHRKSSTSTQASFSMSPTSSLRLRNSDPPRTNSISETHTLLVRCITGRLDQAEPPNYWPGFSKLPSISDPREALLLHPRPPRPRGHSHREATGARQQVRRGCHGDIFPQPNGSGECARGITMGFLGHTTADWREEEEEEEGPRARMSPFCSRDESCLLMTERLYSPDRQQHSH